MTAGPTGAVAADPGGRRRGGQSPLLPLRRIRPAPVDLALAALTAVGVLTGTVLLGGRVDYAGAIPLAVSLGLVLLVRRRWPVAVLLVSVQAVIAFRTAGLTDVGWAWPASVAYFTVAAGDRAPRSGLAWAIGIGLVELGFAANWEWVVSGTDPRAGLAGVGAEAMWLAVVLSAATAYRNWHRWRDEVAAGLRRAESEHELRLRQRAAQERLQIARELHDLVAHTLTVVGVQLRVAAEALDDSPDEARVALRTAQQVRGKAVADLRSLVGVLRDPDRPEPAIPTPERGLDGLDDLLSRVRAGGLDVELEAVGDATAVPAPVALAVYRVVQEALTNTVRHAGASRATVRLRYTADAVSVEVVDDGTGPGAGTEAGHPAGTGAGHGISGMRERVTALGGTFAAGAAGAGGGYAVRATVPVPSLPS